MSLGMPQGMMGGGNGGGNNNGGAGGAGTWTNQVPQQGQEQHMNETGGEQVPAEKQICRDFQRGHCPRGVRCHFMHIPPDPSKPQLPSMRPRELCRDFRRGNCSRGAGCPFLHYINGKQVCRDFNRGGCPRKNECHFVHFVLASGPPDGDIGRKRPRISEDEDADDRSTYYATIMDDNAILRKDNTALREENVSLRKEIEALKQLDSS